MYTISDQLYIYIKINNSTSRYSELNIKDQTIPTFEKIQIFLT